MRRDRVTFAMMLGVPLILLVLFGYAINNDPKALPAAVVTASHDQYSRAMITALELTGYYRFTHVTDNAAEAEALIQAGRRRLRGDHPVGLRRAGGAGRPPADPGRGRRHRPRLGERRHRHARHRRLPGAPARHRRGGGGGGGGGGAARGGGAPPLQPRGHLAVQHRAGPPGRHPADDHGDDDLDRADPRDRAGDDGDAARHALDPGRGDALEDPALLRRGRRRRWRWCCWRRAGSSRCPSSGTSRCS